jgi:hypothetical protein
MRTLVAPASLLYRRWILSRAEKASTRLACAIEDQSDAVDAILASIDRELDWARGVMKTVEERARDVDWHAVRDSFLRRERAPCPICLREIARDDCSVTSCGHGFHKACLQSWMQFCRKADASATCPCCRSPFQHQPLVHAGAMPRPELRYLFAL